MSRAVDRLSILLLLFGMATAIPSAVATYDEEPSAYDRLHDAIERGDLEETAWLAERFPTLVNESREGFDMQGYSCYPAALERAVRADDQTMARLLLKLGASANPKGSTAQLHLVQSAGMAELLIDAGANLRGWKKSYSFSHQTTPLHSALDVSIAKTLLTAGAELNIQDQDGHTPLATAIHRERIAVAKFLLQQGAKVASNDTEALTDACRLGELEIAVQILEQGVKIGNCEEYGTDTLHAACESGNAKLVEMLLKRGANPSLTRRHSPFPAAQTAQMPLRMDAEHHDHAAILKLLKEAGARLDVRDEEGNTLLHLASRAGNPETVRYLIQCGLDVKARNKHDQTPLHLAAMVAEFHRGYVGDPKLHAAVAELLLIHGADPNSKAVVKNELRDLSEDGESVRSVIVSETFTPAAYASRRSKWSPFDGEIDASQCENASNRQGFFLIQGATKETNARIAKQVENANLAREAVGEVLERFGAK